MSAANPNETEDEKLARELQEQFNAEIEASKKQSTQAEEQLLKDIEFAKKLAEEEEASSKGGKESTVPKETGDLSLGELHKKQQEEMDILLAMKLQEEMYQQGLGGEFVSKPPPKPQAYFPQPLPQFHRQKPDPSRLPPTAEAVKRITSDLKEVLMSKNRDLNVMPDEDDLLHIQALIIGPPDTPYANGFFHFDMIYPHDYPWRPPKVQLITTDNGQTRFNPNLYANGKVCLSILGTWSGPGWTQIQTMLSTLLSIQSLMNPKPYHNEPGYEQERNVGAVEKYNQCIQHETIRVAVCGMMELPTCGTLFQDVMEEIFLEKFSEYEAICSKLAPELDGKQMEDPFGERRGTFKYGTLLKRLRDIKQKLEEKKQREAAKEETMDLESTNGPAAPTTKPEKEEPQPMDMDKLTLNTPPQQIAEPSAPVVQSPVSPANPAANPSNPSLPPAMGNDLVDSIMKAMMAAKPSNSGETTDTTQVPLATSLGEAEQAAKQIVDNMLVEVSAALSADEEFAKQLQEKEYSGYQAKGGYGHYGGSPFGYHGSYNYDMSGEPASGPPGNYTPVKPPSMTELLAQPAEPQEKEGGDGIVCLVCHGSPKEYIILPNCQQPHIYCMACAGKMVKQGPPVNQYNYPRRHSQKRGNAQSIQCVLCSSVSPLDPVGGLSSLRRRKRQRTETKRDKCSEHAEEYCLFCMDCVELICYQCAGAVHSRHNLEALDTAQVKYSSDLAKHINTLESKKSKLESFVQTVQTEKEKLSKGSDVIRQEAKAKFVELRRLLDEKEKEMEEGIKRMENNKVATIANEIAKAQQRVSKIDETLGVVQGAMCEKTPLGFLQKMEDTEEQIRHSSMAADLEVKPRWFQMPPLNLQYLEQIMRNMQYREKLDPYGNPTEQEDYYSEEDEY